MQDAAESPSLCRYRRVGVAAKLRESTIGCPWLSLSSPAILATLSGHGDLR